LPRGSNYCSRDSDTRCSLHVGAATIKGEVSCNVGAGKERFKESLHSTWHQSCVSKSLRASLMFRSSGIPLSRPTANTRVTAPASWSESCAPGHKPGMDCSDQPTVIQSDTQSSVQSNGCYPIISSNLRVSTSDWPMVAENSWIRSLELICRTGRKKTSEASYILQQAQQSNISSLQPCWRL